jgi:hypothetical protein
VKESVHQVELFKHFREGVHRRLLKINQYNSINNITNRILDGIQKKNISLLRLV